MWLFILTSNVLLNVEKLGMLTCVMLFVCGYLFCLQNTVLKFGVLKCVMIFYEVFYFHFNTFCWMFRSLKCLRVWYFYSQLFIKTVKHTVEWWDCLRILVDCSEIRNSLLLVFILFFSDYWLSILTLCQMFYMICMSIC